MIREFKLENNYLLWSKFLWEKCLQYFFGGILFLMIAGKVATIIELAKILYHTVLSSVKPIPHMINEMVREHW